MPFRLTAWEGHTEKYLAWGPALWVYIPVHPGLTQSTAILIIPLFISVICLKNCEKSLISTAFMNDEL